MTRTLHIDVDLTVDDTADDLEVADAVLNALHNADEEQLGGIWSIDGAEPRR